MRKTSWSVTGGSLPDCQSSTDLMLAQRQRCWASIKSVLGGIGRTSNVAAWLVFSPRSGVFLHTDPAMRKGLPSRVSLRCDYPTLLRQIVTSIILVFHLGDCEVIWLRRVPGQHWMSTCCWLQCGSTSVVSGPERK